MLVMADFLKYIGIYSFSFDFNREIKFSLLLLPFWQDLCSKYCF